MLDSLEIETVLCSHQERARDRALLRNSFCLFHETGTGKTLTALSVYVKRCLELGRFLPLLVIAPSAVCWSFAEEIDKHFLTPPKVCVLAAGLSADARVRLLEGKRAQIYIINNDGLNIDRVFSSLLSFGFEFLIVDEAHNFKNVRAKRTKKILNLAKNIPYRLTLTGTPITKTALDLWPILQIGAPGFWPDYTKFRDRFCFDANATKRWANYPDWKTRKVRIPQLAESVRDATDWQPKNEVLDLPRTVYQKHYVEFTESQLREYERSIRDLDPENSTAAGPKLMNLREICAGIRTDEQKNKLPVQCGKYAVLEEILLSVPQNESLIIWTNFRPTYARLAKVCSRLGLKYCLYTGDQNQAERRDSIAKFRAGEARVLIANPACAGEGLNLAEAAYRIYFSKSYSFTEYEQSKARNERRGSEVHEQLVEISLITKGSVEQAIEKVLKAKGDVHDLLRELKLKGANTYE